MRHCSVVAVGEVENPIQIFKDIDCWELIAVVEALGIELCGCLVHPNAQVDAAIERSYGYQPQLYDWRWASATRRWLTQAIAGRPAGRRWMSFWLLTRIGHRDPVDRGNRNWRTDRPG
jgi:hypothetical protein